MSYIKIHQEKATDKEALAKVCPFGAIEIGQDGALSISAACRMCRMCIRKGGGVFEFIEEKTAPAVDKSLWRGIAVYAEQTDGKIHPVTFELLGKARELAAKCGYAVYGILAGSGVSAAAKEMFAYGADEVFVYDTPALREFRVEPYAAVLEDFVLKKHPSVLLVGGTVSGRSLAPRIAARFRTGLTADCTSLDISASSDLDQIRPAYGGNIMAHINTPNHRPQLATVRYKIFPIPPRRDFEGVVHACTLPEEKLRSGIEVLSVREKEQNVGIEESEVLVVAGRGVKKREDLSLLRTLAEKLNGQLASTRALVECGWMDAKSQIGLSGRTVKPKLIITCGVSGAIQFVAGMDGAEKIIAINSDPQAEIFKVAHIGIVGDLYQILPGLLERIGKEK